MERHATAKAFQDYAAQLRWLFESTGAVFKTNSESSEANAFLKTEVVVGARDCMIRPVALQQYLAAIPDAMHQVAVLPSITVV